MDSLTGMWVNFFTAAGIPSDVGATYAITFTENRIQNDMLLDLNKEYLRDMGISRMGDVIAILRHAKSVHESAARERVLSTAGSRVPVAAVAARLPASAHTKPSSPVSRMLERYTRNVPQPEPQETPAVNFKRKMTEACGSSNEAKKSRHIEITTTAPPRPSAGTASKKNVFSRLGGTSEPEITETPMNEADAVSRTIFSRLGNKSLTVNVDATQRCVKQEVRGEALKYEGILKSQPQVKKVVVNMAPPLAVARKTVSVGTMRAHQTISVGAMRANQTVSVGTLRADQTVSAGTMRADQTVNVGNLRADQTVRMGTMRADQAPISVKEKLALPKVKSVKFSNHVDYKVIEPLPKKRIIFQSVTSDTLKPLRDDTPVFNKPERRLSMPTELNVAEVKSRLGTRPNLQRNVFTRLGGP